MLKAGVAVAEPEVEDARRARAASLASVGEEAKMREKKGEKENALERVLMMPSRRPRRMMRPVVLHAHETWDVGSALV